MRESQYNVWVRYRGAMYVYGGVSGVLLKVPIPEYRRLRQYLAGDARACSPSLVHNMVQARMLLDDTADETATLKARGAQERPETDPLANLDELSPCLPTGGSPAVDFDPFADVECRSCPALPICMGACASREKEPAVRRERCSAVRHGIPVRIRAFLQRQD